MEKRALTLTVGEAIRRIRKRLGKNTTEFGRMVGSTSASISRYENGKMPPSRSMAMLFLTLAKTDEEKEPLSRLIAGDMDAPEESPIAELRAATRMAPSVFAAVLDCSESELEALENGTERVSHQTLEALKQLAIRSNRPDLAVVLGGPWGVRHVIEPGETLISAGKVDGPRRGAENKPIRLDDRAKWHELLDEILSSEDEDAIIAVQHNLVVFGKTVRMGRKSEKKKSG